MVDRDRPAEAMREEHGRHPGVPDGVEKPEVTSNGNVAEDAEFERQMAIGKEVMRKHRNVLAALAK